MKPTSFIKVFFAGMIVSFIGSLPLGTLNIAAMQISISDGVAAAMLFSLGSLTAEIIYVRMSLVAMDWVRKQDRILKILDWLTFVVVGLLAVSNFYAATQREVEKNIILSSSLPKPLLGFVMSAINPVQIPFWFGWSTVLFAKKILVPSAGHYNTYIIGIGLGTFFGNCVFIFGGQWVAGSINGNGHIVSWVIGGIFALTALLQLIKIFRRKDTSHQIH
jgi:threonine/homoserine/homoserine lactone efflux protein